MIAACVNLGGVLPLLRIVEIEKDDTRYCRKSLRGKYGASWASEALPPGRKLVMDMTIALQITIVAVCDFKDSPFVWQLDDLALT